MKAVILAGGLGTRLSEETVSRPKPMVEIGGIPILIHIMRYFYKYQVTDFIICLGFKGYHIKEYFLNYSLHNSDVTFDFKNGDMDVHQSRAEPWNVTLVDTGLETMTGGRLKRVEKFIDKNEPFFFTYGDGLADINLKAEYSFHKMHGGLATVAAVHPPGRFGRMEILGDRVSSFLEKPAGDGSRINGGFFVLDPDVLKFIEGDSCVWEEYPLTELSKQKELYAFCHDGFWQPMDTLRDKISLEEIWNSGDAPWK